jgi:hypothetical protein
MKKGKSIKLNLFNPIKSVYGTVDSKNLKSIYINIQSWVTPKTDNDNWNRVVCNLSREIKHSVYNSINQSIFNEHSIVDLDLRTSGISYGKKSFFNLEVNLYSNNNIDFKSTEIKESVKNTIKNIFKNDMVNNEYFEFSISKKDTNLTNYDN